MVRLGECISNDQAHGQKLKNQGKVLAKQFNHLKSLNRMVKIGSNEKTMMA